MCCLQQVRASWGKQWLHLHILIDEVYLHNQRKNEVYKTIWSQLKKIKSLLAGSVLFSENGVWAYIFFQRVITISLKLTLTRPHKLEWATPILGLWHGALWTSSFSDTYYGTFLPRKNGTFFLWQCRDLSAWKLLALDYGLLTLVKTSRVCVFINPRTYLQIHTPTVVRWGGGGVWNPSLEFLICCSILKRFYF